MAKHPVIHLLHDAGLAAWTGGSLMGAIGLNGASAALDDPYQRSRASTAGWSRWAPVNAAAVAAHVIGGAGLTVTDWSRVRNQEGVGRSTAVKAAVTGAGLGIAAWSAVLNRKMAASLPAPVRGATEPGVDTPPDVARTQRQLQLVQWLNPLVGFALLAATAVHEEQMRSSEQAKGRLQGLLGSASSPTGLGVGALALTGLGLLASRRRSTAQSTRTQGGLESRPVGGAEVPAFDVVEVVEVDVVDLTADESGPASSTTPGAGRSSTR